MEYERDIKVPLGSWEGNKVWGWGLASPKWKLVTLCPWIDSRHPTPPCLDLERWCPVAWWWRSESEMERRTGCSIASSWKRGCAQVSVEVPILVWKLLAVVVSWSRGFTSFWSPDPCMFSLSPDGWWNGESLGVLYLFPAPVPLWVEETSSRTKQCWSLLDFRPGRCVFPPLLLLLFRFTSRKTKGRGIAGLSCCHAE